MSVQLKIIRAGQGDALLVNYKGDDRKYHNILIDGGNATPYHTNLKKVIKEIIRDGQRIDLMVVTHIDGDHIKGIIKLTGDIKDQRIGKDAEDIVKGYWFNSNELIKKREFRFDSRETGISVSDGVALDDYLREQGTWSEQLIVRPEKYVGDNGITCLSGAKMTVLSPSEAALINFHQQVDEEWQQKKLLTKCAGRREYKDYDLSIDELVKIEEEKRKNNNEDVDGSVINGSSIAFLFEYNDHKILFSADAHHREIVRSLEDLGYSKSDKLKVDYVKLSHHGSRASTSFDLLEMLDCQNFIISTNGSNHNLPHKAVFAKILARHGGDKKRQVNFIFNYPRINYESYGLFFTNEERDKYNFACFYGNNQDYGYNIKVDKT